MRKMFAINILPITLVPYFYTFRMRSVKEKLYPTYSKFNYIYSYTFCTAKGALNA